VALLLQMFNSGLFFIHLHISSTLMLTKRYTCYSSIKSLCGK